MQAELAERAGVPKSTVGRIESGARVPSTLMVERLVQASGPNVSVSLSEGGVRYILIGGMAAVLHGDVGVTVDIDVVPERTEENLDRLALPRLRRLLDRLSGEG